MVPPVGCIKRDVVRKSIRQLNLTYFVGQQSDGGHRPMATATGAVEITLPVAIVAAAYIIGQGLVDTWGE